MFARPLLCILMMMKGDRIFKVRLVGPVYFDDDDDDEMINYYL